MSSSNSHVTVIGAGVVGLSCARWLQRGGHGVTVIDPVAPGESCSFGNAGIISTSSAVPLAMPGTILKVPGWMMDPTGPLVVRWSYMLSAMPWLLRLLAASQRSRIPAIVNALSALNAPALDAFKDLMDPADFTDLVRRDGSINAYESVAALEADTEIWELRKSRGGEFERVEGAALRELEPALNPAIPCAMFVKDSAHTVNPLRVVKTLAERFLSDGGDIVESRASHIDCGDRGPRMLHLDSGAERPVETLVIAAGAWSRQLSAPLGSTPPLEAERGYHVTIADPGITLKRPVSLSSRGFYATPMELGLRVAGTVEFAGVDAAPNYRRADILLDHGRFLLPGLNDSAVTKWMGCRPSLPDSLPVISRSPHHEGLYYAFGHGHLGLTESAITGKLIAEMIDGRPTSIDIRPYDINRF